MNKPIIKWTLAGVLIVALLAAPLVAACSQPAPAPAPQTTAPAAPPTAAKPVASPTPTPASKLPDKLVWDLNVLGSPRALTYHIEDWAKDMKEGTGGRWEIRVQYGEVLAPIKDSLDGLKSGLFAAAFFAAMYNPGKTPLLTAMDNPFLGPLGQAQAEEWAMAVAQHPAIVKELDGWNAQILFPASLANYHFMGKKPFKKVEDLKGLRVRIDPIAGRPLEDFGAVLTNIPTSEMYTALERGMLDTIVAPWSYTFGAYKTNELSKYATIDVDLKVSAMYVAASKTAWNALPDEWKKLANESFTKAISRHAKYNEIDDEKWVPIYVKQGIEIYKLPPEERGKLVDKAKAAWEAWVKEMEGKGLPARDVLNFAIAKRDEIIAKAKK